MLNERTQTDELGDVYSEMNYLSCEDSKDVARQEFKNETDVNYILSKFGVDFQRRPVVSGEVDFDLNLQTAYEQIAEAQEAFDALTAPIKKEFPTVAAFSRAMENGQLSRWLDREEARRAKIKADALAAAESAKTAAPESPRIDKPA